MTTRKQCHKQIVSAENMHAHETIHLQEQNKLKKKGYTGQIETGRE